MGAKLRVMIYFVFILFFFSRLKVSASKTMIQLTTQKLVKRLPHFVRVLQHSFVTRQ